jgi:hypothetical protein
MGSDARRQICADLQRRTIELAPVLPLISPIRTYAMSARLHDLSADATGATAFPLPDPGLEA